MIYGFIKKEAQGSIIVGKSDPVKKANWLYKFLRSHNALEKWKVYLGYPTFDDFP